MSCKTLFIFQRKCLDFLSLIFFFSKKKEKKKKKKKKKFRISSVAVVVGALRSKTRKLPFLSLEKYNLIWDLFTWNLLDFKLCSLMLTKYGTGWTCLINSLVRRSIFSTMYIWICYTIICTWHCIMSLYSKTAAIQASMAFLLWLIWTCVFFSF